MKTRLLTALIALFLSIGARMANADELFKASLSGDNEVPPVITESTGKAFLRLNKAQTEIEIQLHVNDGVRITQSHIHCAPAGVNGPVIIFLAGNHSAGLNIDGKWISNATITNSSITNTACGSTVAAVAQSMRNGNTYVNVHSVANSSGVIRGQIESAE